VPNPRNPRRHSDEQIERLMASLRRDGQTKPVLARLANHMLIAGHGVTRAAIQLGWTEIRALLWDVDQATADRVMLADNRLGDLSEHDAGRVAELLRGMDPTDYFAAGFSPDEAAKLFATDDTALDIVEVHTGDVADDFWVSVRGPLALQAEVLARIKVLLAEYPAVAVDLGTIDGGL
jgi:ParB-like nuclease domain